MFTEQYDASEAYLHNTLCFGYQDGVYHAGFLYGNEHRWWDMDMDCPAWRAFHDGTNAPLKNYVHSHAGQIVYADLNEYGYLSVVVLEDEASASELSGKNDIIGGEPEPETFAQNNNLFPANTPKANEAILDG